MWNSSAGYQAGKAIMDIATDRKGELWIITPNAITRFNGTRFVSINTSGVSHNEFISFHESAKSPYVIDYTGQVFFVEADTLRSFPANDTLPVFNGYNRHASSFFDDQDRLHIGFRYSGYLVVDTNGTVSRPLEHVRTGEVAVMAGLREGQLPFISVKGAIDRQKTWRLHFYIYNAQRELVDSLWVNQTKVRYPATVVQLNNGNYLLSNGFGYLIEFNDTGIVAHSKPREPIFRMMTDRHKGLWVSTMNNGVHYYPNGRMDPDDVRYFFKGVLAGAPAEDPDGGIWMYSPPDGLLQLPRPNERYYSKEGGHLPFREVTTYALAGDTVYLSGTKGRLSSLNLNTHALAHDTLSLRRAFKVHSMHYSPRSRRLWLAQRGHIYYRENGALHRIRLPDEYQDVEWITGRDSRYYLTGSAFRAPLHYEAVGWHTLQFFMVEDTVITNVSERFPSWITQVMVTGDSTWVGTMSGLYLQRGDQRQFLGDQHAQLANTVDEMTFFRGSVWLAMKNRPLCRLTNGQLDTVRFHGEVIYSGRLLHRDNELWVFNQQGSFRFFPATPTGNDSLDIAVYQPLVLRDGVKLMAHQRALLRNDPAEGLMRLNWQHLMADTLAPAPLRIAQLKINRQPQPVSRETYRLAYDEGFLQINYIGLNYRGEGLRYRYRMRGQEERWTETNETYTQYTTLPPGSYTFEVQVRKGKQPWSASEMLQFEISPPVWQTWWFR
ncbi:MAG: triple tyrosine motif-containing protein, partial [Bacteroidota bacterium]